MPNNFEQMMEVIAEVFDVKNDPDQLDITPEVVEKLRSMHPSTMNEMSNDDGPLVWILLIPTIESVMDSFVRKDINESELLELTPVDALFTCIYLCSASVLPEYRRKGLAKKLTIEAIESIRKAHPIKKLFYWPFSTEGETLAGSIAKAVDLPMVKRNS